MKARQIWRQLTLPVCMRPTTVDSHGLAPLQWTGPRGEA